MKNIYKFIFLAVSVSWLVISRIFYTENTSIEYLALVTVIYSIGIHWMYAYIFDLDMHYNVGKVKPNENKIARLLLFFVGAAICVAITCYV